MKIGKWARLLICAAPILAGCKGFWDAPTGGGGGGSSTLSSGVFYVLNQTAAQIAAYSIVSGKLTAVTGSPFALPSSPYAIAVAPNGSFLYVSTSTGIYLCAIGTGGELTLNTTAIFADTTGYAIAVESDTNGSWLLDASFGNLGTLYAFPINSSTGASAITATNPIQQVAMTTLTAPQEIAITPDNKFVIVALGDSGTAIVPFTTSSTAGTDPLPATLAATEIVKVKGSGGAAVSVAADPQSRVFYIGEIAALTGSSNTGGVRVFNYSSLSTISTTAPTEVSGSPFASGGLAPYSIRPGITSSAATSGNYVYVANRTVTAGSNAGNVTTFAVTTTGTVYSLTGPSFTASAGNLPISLAEDNLHNYLLVANSGGSSDLQGYNFDTTTAGKLDSVLTSTTGTDPVGAVAVAAAP